MTEIIKFTGFVRIHNIQNDNKSLILPLRWN